MGDNCRGNPLPSDSFFTFFGDLLWNFVCFANVLLSVVSKMIWLLPTCDDCAEFIEECDEYDGQPDEMQEWADFDPDC